MKEEEIISPTSKDEDLATSSGKKTEKETNFSYADIIKSLDVEEEEKKELEKQYKKQLHGVVSANGIKEAKKELYRVVTNARAEKIAEEKLSQKVLEAEKEFAGNGLTPLTAEEVKEILDTNGIDFTEKKNLVKLGKQNPVVASYLRELVKTLPSNNSYTHNVKISSDISPSEQDLKNKIAELDAKRPKGLTHGEEKRYNEMWRELIKKNN